MAKRKPPTVPRTTSFMHLMVRALLADPVRETYGLQMCAVAGLPSGTIDLILVWIGWLTSRRERVISAQEGRSQHWYCKLTEDGADWGRLALAQAANSTASPHLAAPSAGGTL